MSGPVDVSSIIALGQWALEHAESPVCLPPAGAPMNLTYAAIHALREAFGDDSERELGFLAGMATVNRFMVEKAGCDYVASILALDMAGAEQAS